MACGRGRLASKRRGWNKGDTVGARHTLAGKHRRFKSSLISVSSSKEDAEGGESALIVDSVAVRSRLKVGGTGGVPACIRLVCGVHFQDDNSRHVSIDICNEASRQFTAVSE